MPIEIRTTPGELAHSTTVWRYLEISAALDTLVRNRLRFTQVNSLDDQWEGRRGPASRKTLDDLENALAQHSGISFPNYSMRYGLEETNLRYNNYISSWTTNSPDSMIMWLAYTKTSSSVALGSTIEKLHKGLVEDPLVGTIGLVDYVNQNTDPPKGYGLDPQEELFRKRKAFSFEGEVRFLINKEFDPDHNGPNLADRPTYHFENILRGTISTLIVHPNAPEEFELLLETINSEMNLGILVERSAIATKPIG